MLALTTASSFISATSSAGAETGSSVAAGGPVGVATTVDGPDRNNVVTITVPIDLVPGSPELAPAVRRLARTWERQAEDGWNNAFEFFQYKCFTLHLDVDIKVRPVGFVGSDDRHRVLVATAGGGTPGYDGSNTLNPNTGLRDGTRSFDSPRDGIFREDQSEATTLHEVGHLLGLGDDYVVVRDPNTGKPVEPRQTRPKPGRDGTLMGDGGVVDQALVDRIGKQIEKLLDDLPACEVWEGKITGQVTRPGCSPSNVPLSGTVNIAVAKDKTVSGTAIEGWGGCSIPGGAVPAVNNTYTVTGRKTAAAFKLSVSGTGTRKMTIPIDGTHATVTFDEGSGFTGHITYTLDCTTCSVG